MKRENLALFISIIAGVISIVAICTSLNAFTIGETAYLGWAIAALSTLVVVLIGWNILSVIDVKSEIEKMNKRVEGIDQKNIQWRNENLAMMVNLCNNLSLDVYRSLYEFYARNPTEVEPFVRHGLCYLEACIKTNDIDGQKAFIEVFRSCLRNPVSIRRSDKDKLKEMLYSIKDKDKIVYYEEIKSKIADMRET
jgi:hypothetical protein